ncbi:MAG: hypothetical protein O6934_11320 [SAR324 cluster bacterium]|nr:hypothetical protein [SAR324 cluster bacterium]
MLKIFYELGEMDNIEDNLLAEASNRLDVGEFQVFQLSYNEWHGNDLEPKRMEQMFFDYLTENKLPPWARHYARRIIDLDDQGKLEHTDLHYHRYDVNRADPLNIKKGLTTIIAVTLFMAAFLIISSILLDKSREDLPRCYFPPCINTD